MRPRRLAQCTAAFLLLASVTYPCGAVFAGQPLPVAQAPHADVWEDILLWYLERLNELLDCGRPLSGTAEERMAAVTTCFHSGGIPAGANAEEGCSIIEDLYRHLTEGGGSLDAGARERFLTDLRVMYAAFGGDPSNLGQGSF
jgi:hypothetical protein